MENDSPRRNGETISTAAGMINRLDFKGRVAVITGGAVSIGYTIAHASRRAISRCTPAPAG
jgi:hypothetical protein